MEKIVAYVGNDVHQAFIEATVYQADEQVPIIEKRLLNKKINIQKFYKKLSRKYEIRACYEAGGCGYMFYRWLNELNIHCDVIAPSLIPKRSGDRIKTDKRDAKKLGKLYRAGELVAIHVPNEEEESNRGLVRLRGQIKKEMHQSKQYILKFLQIRGLVYKDGGNWTEKHWTYLRKLQFERKTEEYTYQRYLELLEYKMIELRSIESEIEKLAFSEKYEKRVRKLRCLRGIDVITAMTIITGVIDFKRFTRATKLMAYLGLIPSQYSSGDKQSYGKITATGNGEIRRVLVEAAWHYRNKPSIYRALRKRQEGQSMEVINYSWKAQRRLFKKFSKISFKRNKNVAVVAVARELTGFIWSLMVNEKEYSL